MNQEDNPQNTYMKDRCQSKLFSGLCEAKGATYPSILYPYSNDACFQFPKLFGNSTLHDVALSALYKEL